jgi:IclR family transcriptional regulator, KDG regulon repressor
MSETSSELVLTYGKATADLVARTIDLLLCFSIERPEWGVTELATALPMTKSRVHRILRTLEERGFLHKNPVNRKYRLGLRAFELGTVAARGIGRGGLLRRHLEQLADRLGATISLRVRDNDETVLVESVESLGPVRIIVTLGSRYPIYYGAAGMAISSALSESELDRLLPDGRLTRYTPASFGTTAAFRRALSQVRARGYAVSDERAQPGVRSIGVPVRDAAGRVICGLVAGFAKAILPDEKIPEVGRVLIDTAPGIGRLLEQFDLVAITAGGDVVPGEPRANGRAASGGG